MNAPIPEIRQDHGVSGEEMFELSLLEEPLHCDQTGMPVLELLEAMSRFHRLRDLSHQERYGAPHYQSRRALLALSALRQSLQETASSMGESGQELVVEASLSLRMLPRAATQPAA